MSPPANRDIRVARDYHDRTAHSDWSVRQSGHYLDWDIKPFLYKVYPDLPAIQLPRDLPLPAAAALEALSGVRGSGGRLTLEALVALLFFSAGLTRQKTYPGGEEMHFRAAPSTGALYQTEVYVVTGGLPDLAAGIYHYCPGDSALRRLREGDFRPELAAAAADPGIARAPATWVLTAIYWRNTWKYQARGYRHLFWDSGTMLANLLATASGLSLDARLVTGFVDSRVNRLLGLDPEKEGSLELAVVSERDPTSPADRAIVAVSTGAIVEPIAPRSLPLSSREVDYPLLREMHAASSLADPGEVAEWRSGQELRRLDPPRDLLPLPPPRSRAGPGLGETIIRRASTREFARVSISAEELSTVLFHATRGAPADFPSGLVDLYLIVSAVEGIPPGAYCYWPSSHGLELLKAGEFRAQAGHLCLEQALGADASCVVFFLADLARILERCGNRGYRLANLEAGLIGGRCYLGAYAQGFGASGLTFYDGEVVNFFSPHAEGKDAIFVTALGRSVKGSPRSSVPLQITRS